MDNKNPEKDIQKTINNYFENLNNLKETLNNNEIICEYYQNLINNYEEKINNIKSNLDEKYKDLPEQFNNNVEHQEFFQEDNDNKDYLKRSQKDLLEKIKSGKIYTMEKKKEISDKKELILQQKEKQLNDTLSYLPKEKKELYIIMVNRLLSDEKISLNFKQKDNLKKNALIEREVTFKVDDFKKKFDRDTILNNIEDYTVINEQNNKKS